MTTDTQSSQQSGDPSETRFNDFVSAHLKRIEPSLKMFLAFMENERRLLFAQKYENKEDVDLVLRAHHIAFDSTAYTIMFKLFLHNFLIGQEKDFGKFSADKLTTYMGVSAEMFRKFVDSPGNKIEGGGQLVDEMGMKLI